MKPILRKVDSGHNYSFSIHEDIYPFLYNHWHYHPEAELAYIRKGTGIRLAGDSVEQFEDGDLILLGADLPHYWRSDVIYFKENSGMQVEAVAIHFKEDFWGRDFLELPEMLPIKKLLQQAKRGIKISGKTKKIIIPKMEAMLTTTNSGRIEGLLNLLQIIAGSKDRVLLSSTGFTKMYDTADTERINDIYNYTFNNFKKQITVKKIAAAVNISPNSFCRYFKTRTLKTYWQFLIEVRIGNACKLLIENKMSVAAICYECGFNNLSNFNRHFKSIIQMNPLQYSKTYLQGK